MMIRWLAFTQLAKQEKSFTSSISQYLHFAKAPVQSGPDGPDGSANLFIIAEIVKLLADTIRNETKALGHLFGQNVLLYVQLSSESRHEDEQAHKLSSQSTSSSYLHRSLHHLKREWWMNECRQAKPDLVWPAAIWSKKNEQTGELLQLRN